MWRRAYNAGDTPSPSVVHLLLFSFLPTLQVIRYDWFRNKSDDSKKYRIQLF